LNKSMNIRFRRIHPIDNDTLSRVTNLAGLLGLGCALALENIQPLNGYIVQWD